MSEEQDKSNLLKAPQSYKKAKVLKSIAKVVAGSIPIVGSGLSEIVDLNYPDPEGQDRGRWENEVTDGVNTHKERLDEIDSHLGERRATLSIEATALVSYMIERCPDGLARENVEMSDFVMAFSEFDKASIKMALGELKTYGLIEQFEAIGNPQIYSLSKSTYSQIDKHVMGFDTNEDDQHLAKKVYSSESISVRDLMNDIGWDKRRINPALTRMLEYVSSCNISRTLQPDFVTDHFFLEDEDQFRLKRFSEG